MILHLRMHLYCILLKNHFEKIQLINSADVTHSCHVIKKMYQKFKFDDWQMRSCSRTVLVYVQYCSWENPHFSSVVLSELLWQIAYSYTYELRPYLDLLLHMLLLEDSWQTHRIHNALKGSYLFSRKYSTCWLKISPGQASTA